MKRYNLRWNRVAKMLRCCVGIAIGLWSLGNYAQVTTKLETSSIKIGEELRYTLSVATDTTTTVVFPEGQSFQPLEVIASYAVDTTKQHAGYTLIKEYGLTQFDSGHYTIPRQEVMLNGRKVYSDSLQITVHDVVVDTTKQKLYEIKPLIAVEVAEEEGIVNYWWMVAVGIVVLGLLAFLWRRKKKKQAIAEEQIPPYERAIEALKQIDASDLLTKASHKEYYSKLSDTARKYIDEELYDRAMESTTDELIYYLQEQAKTGTLELETETITALETVLKTADMAKFAKSKPNIEVAKGDRNVIEEVIHKTKEAIPEPTEAELMADEAFRRKAEEKARQKRIRIGIFSGIGVLLIAIGIFVAVTGVDRIKTMITGDMEAKIEALDWVSSSYGYPPITMRTPEVLVRNNYKPTKAQNEALQDSENFSAGNSNEDWYIALTTVKFKKDTQIDLEKAVEGVVDSFEQQGGKNITVKTEAYETLGGAEGIKVFGSLQIPEKDSESFLDKEYMMLNFAEHGGFQQITVVYTAQDKFAKKVAERIISAVEFKIPQK